MLRPIKDMVVIARDKSETRTEGGIVVPESAQEKVTRGRVLAVGPGDVRASKLADKLEQAVDLVVTLGSSTAVESLVELSISSVAALRARTPTVKEGDHVLFGKYTGNTVSVRDRDGVEHDCVVCRDEEIFGVIEK